MITSEDNVLVKHVKGLQLKKNREKHGQFVIEGLRFLTEALQHRTSIEYILYSDGLMKVKGGEALFHTIRDQCRLVHVAEPLFNKLSETQTPQGILAVVNRQEENLNTLLQKQNPFLVILDRIQDPGNLGTIIRTAEGAGVDGILLTKGCVDLYNSKTLRATMGAVFHLPILSIENGDIGKLKAHGVRMIAAALEADREYHRQSYNGSVGLVFGNEANGIDQAILEAADELVKIPIIGKIESLNAAVAAGILIYKALENRTSNNV